MNCEATLDSLGTTADEQHAKPTRPKIGDLLLTLALGAMVILPTAEAVLRLTLHRGIDGSAAFVQHLTLIVGMVGGAVAAREGRLLALSTVTTFLRGNAKLAAEFIAGTVGAGITAWLCWASTQFVIQERAGQNTIAYGIPRWWVESLSEKAWNW